jgi:hypothetical protein
MLNHEKILVPYTCSSWNVFLSGAGSHQCRARSLVSGTFKVGVGHEFDANKMWAFIAGSSAFLDPVVHHYAMACGETIVQVHGQSLLRSTT